ncbi:MAG: hypothetical protein FWE35_10880 [Streptosporangiales bacterium]|nr:hypothetical protein [Streptosporangiales bacterium]
MPSEELRQAIDRRKTDVATAPTPTAMGAFGPPDQVTILKTIGLNPADPRAHAVVAVAERYGLDPVLGHLLILPKSNRPYITRDGYNHIAHGSGQLDGIEVVDGPRRDTAEREWVCQVAVYRKDMSRPFIFPGRAELGLDNGPEMALARAERRALKRAFAVTLPSAFTDDENDTRPPLTAQPPVAAPEPAPDAEPDPIEKNQLTALQARFKELGITDRAERLRLISEWAGRKVTSAKALSADEARTVLAHLGERAADQAEEAEVVDEAEPAAEVEDRPATNDQRVQVINAFSAAGIDAKDRIRDLLSDWTGRRIDRTDQLTESEALQAIDRAAALTEREG